MDGHETSMTPAEHRSPMPINKVTAEETSPERDAGQSLALTAQCPVGNTPPFFGVHSCDLY